MRAAQYTRATRHPRPRLALLPAALCAALFNKWCSDKGTYWLSKHNYGAAYEPLFAPRRQTTRNLLELGVGDETAGSLNSWREYFPAANFWIVDIDVGRFRDEPLYNWSIRQKRRHGCFDAGTAHDTWHDKQGRVHPLFGVDASNFTQLRALPVPDNLDIIIDDAAHVLSHQITSLEALWPKLAPGGVFIVEDLTVGALRWLKSFPAADADQKRRVPSENTDCGDECHYVQRPVEHPFLKRLLPAMAQRREAEEALRRSPGMPAAVAKILDDNMWSWAITGAHQGGGLDCTLLITKTEGALPATATDISWTDDIATTLAARDTAKAAPTALTPVEQTESRHEQSDRLRRQLTGATGGGGGAAAGTAAAAGGGGGGGGAADPAWARSLSVHSTRSAWGPLVQVLLFVVAIGLLTSGICGDQRLERFAAELGLRPAKPVASAQ